MNNTGPSTPKLAIPKTVATSTVNRRKNAESEMFKIDDDLSILSLNNVDLSNIASVEDVLSQQRQLASQTLERVGRVSSIPSTLLRPDFQNTNYDAPHSQSTVNESDIIQTPKNTSTPRCSSTDNPRESIFSKLKNELGSSTSTRNAIEKFQAEAQANRSAMEKSSFDSELFTPGEQIESKLKEAELSWKRQNQPVGTDSYSSFRETRNPSCVSLGEFFQQKSDDVSALPGLTPPKPAPIALVDPSILSNVNPSVPSQNQSLSVTFIQKLLADSSNSNALEKLMNHQHQPTNIQESQEESLPVSLENSYTSAVSDNEALRAIINKENIPPLEVNVEITKLSPNSVRSSSALSILADGKLPIESTVNELVWGCVKTDRCSTKQFMLRNKCEKTLRIQCSLTSHEFKIKRDNTRSESDHLNMCKFVLRSHESRILSISFIPTKIGPAVDELIFTPLDNTLKQSKKQCVRLWGYGGYTCMEYLNATRDNTGKYWLSLGRMDNNRMSMDHKLIVKNTGILESFVYIKQISKHMVNFVNLNVKPNLLLLQPNEEKSISVTYVPTVRDCNVLKENFNVMPVVDVGKFEIISGAEVNRVRLRRLYQKCIEKGISVNKLVSCIIKPVPGEIIAKDAKKFKELPSAVGDILETLSIEQLIVTIEQDPNQTLMPDLPEDSVKYQTLCHDSTTMVLNETIHNEVCRLEPPSIVLCPPTKIEDTFYLMSNSPRALPFGVAVNSSGLCISPNQGVLAPGQTVQLKVKLGKNISQEHFQVMVTVDHVVYNRELQVIRIKPSKPFLD